MKPFTIQAYTLLAMTILVTGCGNDSQPPESSSTPIDSTATQVTPSTPADVETQPTTTATPVAEPASTTTASTTPVPTVPDADSFDSPQAVLATVETLEANGEYSNAYKLVREASVTFKRHEDGPKLREAMNRLREFRQEASDLARAVTLLGSDKHDETAIARRELIRGGMVGKTLLLKTLREGPTNAAIQASQALSEADMGNALIKAIIDRIAQSDVPQDDVQSFYSHIETGRGTLNDTSLKMLLTHAKNEPTPFAARSLVGRLASCINHQFNGDIAAFHEAIGDKSAHAFVTDYAEKALSASDDQVYAWAAGMAGELGIRLPGTFVLWDAKAASATLNRGSMGTIDKRGDAAIQQGGVIEFKGGNYLVTGLESELLDACKESNEVSIEAVFNPAHSNQRGPARLISFSTDGNLRNVSLCQEGGALLLRLRTPITGTNGIRPDVNIGPVAENAWTHILVTYRKDELKCYINGEPKEVRQIQGDLSNWDSQKLVLGAEYDGDGRDWHGRIAYAAIYANFINADTATKLYQRHKR